MLKHRSYLLGLTLAVSSLAAPARVRAAPPATGPAWPTRCFAPYLYLTGPKPTSASILRRATGQRYFYLAFVIAGPGGEPAWDGTTPVADGRYYADEVAGVRAAGGDVAVSFGGEGGSELALKAADVPTLARRYRAVIDAYHLRRVDFDVEGHALDDPASIARRNRAVAAVQSTDPDLGVTFTLPVAPDGLPVAAVALLKDAVAAGVRIAAVNLMTMDYGTDRPKQPEGTLAVGSAEAARRQLLAIRPAGLPEWICPMIGPNDVKGETFTPADAAAVRRFADAHDWVTGLTYWAADRDRPNPDGHGGGAPAGTYARTFNGFTTPAPATRPGNGAGVPAHPQGTP